MSTKEVRKIWAPEHIPVTPCGELTNGWSAGTYVYYVDETTNPDFKLVEGTVAMVDKWTSKEGADGSKPNRPAGFLMHGTQSFIDNSMADANYWLTSKEPGVFFELDSNDHTVKKMGTGIATMIIASTGIFKTYQFEQVDSLSNPLTYAPTDILYVSDNSFWTKEVFIDGATTGYYSGYQVARTGEDEDGKYLIVSNAW